MRSIFFCFFIVFYTSLGFAGQSVMVKDELHFRNSVGKKITLEGKLIRLKQGFFLKCDGFTVLLNGFSLEGLDISKEITLTGTAKIYRSAETEEEWNKRISSESPFTHAGYRAEQLVLEAER